MENSKTWAEELLEKLPDPIEPLDLEELQGYAELLPDVLDVEDVAKLLRITPETAMAEVESGKIPGATKVGEEWRVKCDVMLRELFEPHVTIDNDAPFMTVEELAEMVGIDKKTIYHLVQKDEIPGVRHFGKQIRILRSAVLESQIEGNGAPKGRRSR